MNDLKTAAEAMTNFLITERGYDEASFYQVTLTEHILSLNLIIKDHFQEDLAYDQKFRSGFEYFETAPDDPDPIASIWEKIQAVPTREMRELQVLARQTSTTAAMAGKLKSAMASQFVKDIVETRSSNLLTC
jgi:hypothetical protein